jgi:hypothetical protein
MADFGHGQREQRNAEIERPPFDTGGPAACARRTAR